jgi:hypothetical protein
MSFREENGMAHGQTHLHSGHIFESDMVVREIGGRLVALAIAANRDPTFDVTVSQVLVTVDGAEVVRKTLRVEGRSCDSVTSFAPSLGGGRLTLHWALMPDEGGGLLAHGHGDWNGEALAEFAHLFLRGSDGRMHAADRRTFGALRLDSGGFAEPGPPDPAVVEALAGFAEVFAAARAAPVSCVAGCIACAVDCGLGCVGRTLEAEAFAAPACAKLCVMLESTCLVGCAAREAL